MERVFHSVRNAFCCACHRTMNITLAIIRLRPTAAADYECQTDEWPLHIQLENRHALSDWTQVPTSFGNVGIQPFSCYWKPVSLNQINGYAFQMPLVTRSVCIRTKNSDNDGWSRCILWLRSQCYDSIDFVERKKTWTCRTAGKQHFVHIGL